MATKKIRYVGPHVAVELERPDGTTAEVNHGAELETTTDHAESLLEQESNWQPIPKPKTSEKKGGE